MTSTVHLLPFALLAAVLWFASCIAKRDRSHAAMAPVELRALGRLRDRLARGEISADDYNRVRALMQ